LQSGDEPTVSYQMQDRLIKFHLQSHDVL
jgi:hypothetical protein